MQHLSRLFGEEKVVWSAGLSGREEVLVGEVAESWSERAGCVAMLGFYYIEVMCSRFSHAAEVFLHGEARGQLDLLAEPLLFTVVNHVMFGILLVAVVYILAHFLLTAVIVSRLFLVGCWVISSGGPWMSVPVEWLMILNKQCPRLSHAESEPPTQCSVCLEMISPGCVKRKLSCAHQFHARCIEMWFRKANRCPLCLQSIVPCLHDKVMTRLDQPQRLWR